MERAAVLPHGLWERGGRGPTGVGSSAKGPPAAPPGLGQEREAREATGPSSQLVTTGER